MSSNNNNTTGNPTSTLQYIADSASGAVQSGVAYITGSPEYQAKAEQYKNKAAAEDELSHAAVRAGPFTVSSSGVPAKDNPDRTQGALDQTLGSGKEFVGGLIGSEGLKQQGRDQNLAGQQQQAQGQLADAGKGIGDRVSGAVGSAVAGLTGDRVAQEKYNQQHDDGKSRLRGVQMDLDKQADVEAGRANH